jgi:RND family efflux transporter MFP subunit
MMWIVEMALRRPIFVAVMALLMLVLGVLSFTRMNLDIFPAINLPVVMVVWNYPGLSAIDMERRVVIISERAYSTTVNGIEHIESRSFPGIGLIKVYFYPDSPISAAIAQINAVSETILRILPQGMTPPNIIEYNAANVPVAQLNVYSDILSEQQLFDYGLNFIRVKLFTIPGLSSPAPFGGVQRAIMVNLNPNALYANDLSPQDVGNALATTNVVIPSGTARMGDHEYNIDLNMSPTRVEDFNRLPIKTVKGPLGNIPVFLGDVASVTDTHQPQSNVVRVDGKRATYLMIIKHAAASTMAVVNSVKKVIPEILSTAPKGLKLKLTFDQSKFVKGALLDVVFEAGIAAVLVATMVLIFLGSPRSMLIVIISIPLSILTAIIALNLTGQTINIMTLGGLALAVGMLVDDATVEIENIHRNHAMGKPLIVAILDGARQIATPTLVGTLSICIVFFPVVLLYGVGKFLFTPLALSVVFAMLTSYLLSRTLVPAMALSLLAEAHEENQGRGLWRRFVVGFDKRFSRFRERYRDILGKFITFRYISLTFAALVIGASFLLLIVVGNDFFPYVDAGMIRLHVRAPTGTRIEETERIVDDVERTIREIIPANELESISDNIGVPISYNLAFYQTDSVGPQDAEILIQLSSKHHPTLMYQDKIRRVLDDRFPNITSYFQAADIISQVLNFGLPASIDAQISGNNLESDYGIAKQLMEKMKKTPGIKDVRIAQSLDYPAFRVDVDRARALELGINMQQVASSLLTSLSGNSLLQPTFWLDTKTGVNYSVISQTPQHLVDSVDALANTPLSIPSQNNQNNQGGMLPQNAQAQLLSNIATFTHSVDPAVVDHYTVQRVIDVDARVSGQDLGSATSVVSREIKELGKLPPGTNIAIRGQSQAMRESFKTLEGGMILSIILVYLLMAVNFQSWLEPLIIIMAVPGALAGVLWMLVLTRTTINVESLMGAIMAVGVGVANGNLLIIFANELREEGYSPLTAAIEAARIRLRPILMTALAMILGMLPMSLSLGAGGEQNAPLGRAVIGGLLGATLMTLFIIPTVYSIFGGSRVTMRERDERVKMAKDWHSSHDGGSNMEKDESAKNYTPKKPRTLSLIIISGAVLLILLVTGGFVLGHSLILKHKATQLEKESQKGQRVQVAYVHHAPSVRTLEVPGTAVGYIQAPIYAKIPGYLKEISVDKGDIVRKGQVLGILESPETDKQVADAKANYELQKVTDNRNQELFKKGVVAKQVADESHSMMLEAYANYQQLKAIQDYKIIRAPFDGVIAARFVDPGALIPQTTSSTSNTPILTISTLSPIRIYAYVPQSLAPFIKDGDEATITATEFPRLEIKGSVTRHPKSLNDATRTMLIEVDLPNKDYKLYPGMYVKVRFNTNTQERNLEVPDSALVFEHGKTYVPVVRNGYLHLAEVTLGYDDGQTVEVIRGISDNDMVALNVGQAARNGERVQPVLLEQNQH